MQTQRRKRPVRKPIRTAIRRADDGRFWRIGVGKWYNYWRDPYHLLLTIPWTGFGAVVTLAYAATNAVFALAYLAGGDAIAGARPGHFGDAFFFSVQTLATIGYGAMSPQTTYAHLLVTLEALAGLVGIAIVTGLAFARFAQPTARVVFSRFAVVIPYDGVPMLMFRTANERGNQILEAEMRLYLLRDEVSREGQAMRRFHELPLTRNRTPSFTLTWTAMHEIDADSPLAGWTKEELMQTNAVLVVSLNGLDETVSLPIHARHSYVAQEMLWDYRFVDLFHTKPNGDRFIDFTHFHEVEPFEVRGGGR